MGMMEYIKNQFMNIFRDEDEDLYANHYVLDAGSMDKHGFYEYLEYNPLTQVINTNNINIRYQCPGVLMGVISKKGPKHLNMWLACHPEWYKCFCNIRYKDIIDMDHSV